MELGKKTVRIGLLNLDGRGAVSGVHTSSALGLEAASRLGTGDEMDASTCKV
jgi:hypothetical protein